MTKLILLQRLNHSNLLTPPTTSLARRALLLVSFLLLSLGSVWGKPNEFDRPESYRVWLSSEQIPDVFGKSEIILCVYVQPPTYNPSLAVEINIQTYGFTSFTSIQNRFHQETDAEYYNSNGYFEIKLSVEQSLEIKEKGLLITAGNNGTLGKVTYEAPDNFIGSLKTRTDDKTNVGSSSKPVDVGSTDITIDLNNAYNMLGELVDLTQNSLKYVRISIEYNGEAINPDGKLSFTGDKEITDLHDAHGFYIYDSNGLDESKLPSVKLTLTEAELEDYRIVTVWSIDNCETLPGKEPDWDLQYTFAFEYPFKGDATNAIKMESTFKIGPSLQSSDMTLSFDYSNNNVVLKKSSNNEVIATAPIDPNFLNAYSDATQLTNNFYIRWFVQKDGVETYISGSLSDATNGIYKSPAKERYYYYWDADKDNNNRSLNDILKINLKGSQLSSLTDYNLVFTIATEREGIIYDVENKLTHEPNEMAYQYTFHFEDKPFEAENLAMVKTVYKTALYNKDSGKITTQLFANYNDVMSDLSTDRETFNGSAYLRWYVTDINGKLVSDMVNWDFEMEGTFTKNDTYGYYRENGFYEYDGSKYDPVVTLPNGYDYKDYQIVCVVTTDKTGMSLPDNEPTYMQVKYVFSQIIPEDELEHFPFVHYKGLSGRDWVTPEGSNGNMTQKYWANDVDGAVDITADIRQGVHTWEYDIYVVPGEARKLILPFQYYDHSNDGNDDEPRGYIRWYNWNTDKAVEENNFTLTKNGNELRNENNDRGIFGWCLSGNPTHQRVGVTFTPDVNFSESIDIACDVSKYSDGIIEINGKNYLLHEPTLSNRYIFHIRPASESAEELKSAKKALEDAEAIYKGGGKAQDLYDAMSELKEDKGKVVVSLGENMKGEFALRLDHHNLLSYVLENGSDNYVSATTVQWYAYFENNQGVWRMRLKEGNTITDRITTFEYEDFGGNYECLVQNGNPPLKVQNERNFHVVGYVGSGYFDIANNTDLYAPVVHYELSFIEAPPLPLEDLISGNVSEKYLNRTEAYMKANNYTRAGIVDFDGNPETNPNVDGHEAEYYSTSNWYDAPTLNTSVDNSAYEPFSWGDIQYGFCYPTLTQKIRNGYHPRAHYITPEHGDYIILKSMSLPTVSTHWEVAKTSPYEYNIWDKTELHDYTYYATKNRKEGQQHGSFMYTDASDESRIIATIPFTATDLCGGSSIYFTAVVADMTFQHVKPQLLIRIVGIGRDENGESERVRIVAFHTGDIIKSGANTGSWYQVYGASTLSKEFDKSITEFEAEVINYANGTEGADFAFDQFVIYTTSAKVLLTQTPSSSCGDQSIADNKVQIYMEAEGLQNAFDDPERPQLEGLQPIYWRIYEKGESGANDKLVTGVGMYPQYSSDGTLENADTDSEKRNTYGITWVKLDFSDNDLDQISETHPFGWYKDEEGNYFFQLADKSFSALERGKNYYVSVYEPCSEEDFDEKMEGNWGRKEIKCSIYSDFFIPRRQYVTYIVDPETGKEGGELTIPCGSTDVEIPEVQMVFKVPDPTNKITGFTEYPMTFDYAFCSMENWDKSSVELEGDNPEGYTYNELAQAWRDYRDKWLKDNNLTVGNYSHGTYPRYQKALEYAIDQGILILANSEKFSHKFTKNNETNLYHVLCLPIERTVTIKEKQEDGTEKDVETTVCDFFEVIFTVKSGGSLSLVLGFDGVSYPSNYTRVVRVGLEQLNNAKIGRTNGFTIHIPVQSFKSATNNLVFDNEYLTLSKTTDDTKSTSTTTNVALLLGDGDQRATVNSDYQYLAVKFVDDFDFYEGYEYELHTVYYDLQDDKGNNKPKEGVCTGDMNFIIKVVPKYVTWNDGTTAEESNNWNHDKNWSRSTRTELYKGDDMPSNHDSYEDNDDLRKKNVNIGGRPAFVPMKFTYVTMPIPSSTTKAPNLVGLELADNGIYSSMGIGATGNIEYDMMVRYSLTDDDGQDECLGHKTTNGTTTVSGNIYDCEKFYGNWAKEIYFKPNAELVNQHYLTYEKVWVEKELTANTWTLMSTPLQNTYAGDMYVPYSTDATKNGRQETEAFQDIKFTNTDVTYSRTKYPIYQRSWAQTGSTVYTKTNDVRANSYSANIVTNTVGEKLAQWSHTYNDVTVDYKKGFGFAIRAHKKNQSNDALLRLPKEDTDYNYYQWDGNTPNSDGVTQTVTKTTKGKLFTDNTPNINDLTYGVVYGGTTPSTVRTAGNGEVNVDINDVQEANGYLLVGNPYLCSINMSEFLSHNSDILDDSGYWTYENNTVDSKLSGNYIKPLQSFFVKLAAGVSASAANQKIVFNEDMMIDRSSSQPQSVPALTMTASNERGQSSARVMVGEEAKSVETLFDSNLDDVPMVYTVADGQAVSINQLTELRQPIAFGVTCMASDELVEVTFTDVEQLTNGNIYVVDAVTGSRTTIGEGSTLTVQPNDYGRYFLLAGTTGIGDTSTLQKGIMVSVRGSEVKVTSSEELTQVRALTLNGTLTYQHTAGGNEASFTLGSGVYIIQAENKAGEQQTVKVTVK